MRPLSLLELACTRISLFFRNHPNVFYLVISPTLVISLHIVYSLAVRFYPPREFGSYLIYIEFTGNLYLTTHRLMLPLAYGSLIFLVSSLPHLHRKMVETFEGVKESIDRPKEISRKGIRFASSRYQYLFATVTGFLLLFGPFTIIWIFFDSFGVVYMVLPTAVIVVFLYSLITFLSALGLWLILTSIYFIWQVADQQFKTDINDLNPWIDDDEIGGFKEVSNFSLRVFEFLALGILFFSPAALLYYGPWYAVYVFTIIPIGLLFLIITQYILHKAIRRHKRCFCKLAEEKREAGEMTSSIYLTTLVAIKTINDRPVNLNILWGIFISSVVLPTLLWYFSEILKQMPGTV